MNILKSVGLFLLDFVETIVIALAIFIVVYIFLFQPHQVKGNSMLPSFENGEYLLTNKINYRINEPKRGEVIVFKAPRDENYDYIKRIIALPGETVSIKNSQLYINKELFDESVYLPKSFKSRAGRFLNENRQYTLKNNEFFVLGDNRDHSSDSRDWGPIQKENIIGKAWLIYWPLGKAGLVKQVVYSDFSLEALNFLPTNPS